MCSSVCVSAAADWLLCTAEGSDSTLILATSSLNSFYSLLFPRLSKQNSLEGTLRIYLTKSTVY